MSDVNELAYLPRGERFTTPNGWEALFERALWDARVQRAPTEAADALIEFLHAAYGSGTVFPPAKQLFRALEAATPAQVRVVILGQDPYHEPSQAHGLSFSVPEGVPMPPSLRNIFKELYADLGISPDTPYPSTDLTPWAEQGVLLLNSVMSVPCSCAAGHRGRGWEAFTDEILRELDAREQPIAFVLWGKDAQAKRALLKNPKHKILCSAHPSPLSAYRGFFGSRPFSAINAYLKQNGEREIEWVK